MTFSLLILFMLLALAFSRPHIHAHLISEEDYLSRTRTCFVNGFFILFVFVKHINGYLCEPNKMEEIALFILPRGQLIVTSFLFFSGYGIMYSLLMKGDSYASKLLQQRFPALWLNYFLAVCCFVLVNLFVIDRNYSVVEIIQAVLVWKPIGHSVWYVCISLLAYLLIAASYYLVARRGYGRMILLTTCMMACACSLICLFKEACWADTALCIPAGMAFCLYRKRIEAILSACPLPTLLIGLLLMMGGTLIYRAMIILTHCFDLPILVNCGSVLYAVGLCLLQGCIAWKRPAPLILWMGGPALFFLYIFQRIPMNIGKFFGWNTNHRDLYIVACLVVTMAIAYLMIPLCKRLQKLIFGN